MNAEADPLPAALTPLFEALAAAPHAHDFFHTLRRIECASPQAPRLGRGLRPSLEAVRLGQDPELDFAPAALTTFSTSGGVPRLGVRFMGLFGPQGPLPLHLTEYARERARHHADPSFARFADVFHHRLLSLFYRAWADAQPAVQADRPDDDRFAKWLSALFGNAGPAFHARDAVPDAAKRFHAGTLSRGVKNAEGLVTVLRQHFQVPVKVESFVGHWMRLRPQDGTCLGGTPPAGRTAAAPPAGTPAALGRGAIAGSKVWDRQSKFRLHLGPLCWADYQHFLPGSPALPVLRDWVRQVAGLAHDWDLRLGLAAADVPVARLHCGRRRAPGPATRLGLSTWLGDGPRRDRHNLLLAPDVLKAPAARTSI
jgi:type VI secretion system protein ImpH